MCIDQHEWSIKGNIETNEGQTINIDIIKCLGEGCKSDEEIKQYFAARQLYVLSNQIRFDFQKYDAESIIKESVIH